MMNCPRCNGLCLSHDERDMESGLAIEVMRCLNCSWRDYEPTYHAPIEVVKGRYYEGSWDR